MIGILNDLGFYGPFILIILSVYLLWNHKILLFYYVIGIFVNTILNVILKGIIQEPRPIFDDKKVSLALTHAKRLFYQKGVPFDLFGMPSGHAQSSFFSTIFIYLALRKMNITYIYIALTILTCIQRITSNYHSINQVIVGSLIGFLFAFFIYYFSQKKLQGKIKVKADDNGPI
jgi:membrane-associated phospholipid phosphatase